MVPYRMLADLVLVLHFAVVVFVVGGLLAVVVGNLRRWAWVNSFGLRVAHLAAIAVVVVQAWLGRLCPLTVLEAWLRDRAGEGAYTESFIEHWVQRLLYFEAPMWVFALSYTLFAGAVVAAWFRFPPRGKPDQGRAGDA